MKIFCVSKKCNACGECIVQTHLLTEDSAGYAVPVADDYIRDSDLPLAESLVKSCPVGALSIAEKEVPVFDKDLLIHNLEKKLRSISIEDVDGDDLEYDEDDYSVDHGYVSREGCYDYSSERQAENAGREKFRQVYWNQRKNFAISILVQYKSKMLRTFYDFTDPDTTHYAAYSKQFEAVLKETKAELSALSADTVILPSDFAVFRPERDEYFQRWAAEHLGNSDLTSYVNSFFAGFDTDKYHKLSWYENHIYSSSDSQYVGTDWLGSDKYKYTYCYNNVNEEGEDLVSDIRFSLGYPKSYGLLSIDQIAENDLRFVMSEYRDLVDKEIKRKVSDLKAALDRLK